MNHHSLKRAEGEDRVTWADRIAKMRCDDFARRHGLLLFEAEGTVHAEVDGERRVLHQAADHRLVWSETYRALIASVAHIPNPPPPPVEPSPKHSEANKVSREQRRRAEVSTFLRQYARKSHAGHDPNDRRYSREVEGMVRRMRPEEFDELLNGPDRDEAEI